MLKNIAKQNNKILKLLKVDISAYLFSILFSIYLYNIYDHIIFRAGD